MHRQVSYSNKKLISFFSKQIISLDDEWRRQRSVIQPAFSLHKLKEMRTILDQCLNELMVKLDEQNVNVEFDIFNLLKRTSMNIILNCAFGIHPRTHENISEPFFQRCIQVFEFNLFQTILTIFSILLPEFDVIWVAFFKYTNIIRLWLCDHIPYMNRLIDTDPNTWLLHHVENIIRQRCLHGIERMDLLQSMIEATNVLKKKSSVSEKFEDENQ